MEALENETTFVGLCDCGSEALVVRWDEVFNDINVSIFEYSNRQRSLRQRLRFIWRIIRYGTPTGDDVILNKEKAKELAEFLLKKVK